MASKLKDLQVTKVDFVDQGDNKGANLLLFKRKPEEPATQQTPPAKSGSYLKSIIAAIAKSVGATEAQIDAAVEEIAKSDAETFGEKMVQRQLRRTADEIWDYCYALQESLCSILRDQDVPVESKPTLMTQSCAEFSAAVAAAIPKWASGVPSKVEKSAPDQALTEERLQIAKEAKARLDDLIQKAEPEPHTPPAETGTEPPAQTGGPTSEVQKGERDMKIDKSKLSAEEIAALDAIEKKAGIPEDTTPPANTPTEPEEDIYKGLNPTVAAELRDLRKRADEAEEREILAVAKKYELLGKKPEELAPVLKNLKATGGSAYADMIGILDANLAVVQQSSAFNEIGKRGGTGAAVSDADSAWAQIEKKAEEIRKSAPDLTYNQAVDKACEQNPDLVRQYEANR